MVSKSSKIELEEIINVMAKALRESFPSKYAMKTKKQKYSGEEVIENLLKMCKTGCSFNDVQKKMSASNLHKHSQFLKEQDFFKKTYVSLLPEYLSINDKKKLKHQSTDTTFINNKNGIKKALARNHFNKNKFCIKVSYIVDAKGIPISIIIKKGNISDCKFVEDHLKNMLIPDNFLEIKNDRKDKPFILADAAYDSKNLREILKDNGYVPIIPFNKRNTKDEAKIKKLSKSKKKEYSIRIVVENSFCWTKKYKRLRELNERSIEAYESFLFLSMSQLLKRRISKQKE